MMHRATYLVFRDTYPEFVNKAYFNDELHGWFEIIERGNITATVLYTSPCVEDFKKITRIIEGLHRVRKINNV